MVNKDYSFSEALRIIKEGRKPSRELIRTLLTCKGQQVTDLLAAANDLRSKTVGREVHLRGLIEFSNYCHKDCLYCGLRRDNKSLTRYRLDETEILRAVAEAVALNFRTVVLQSGEDSYYKPTDIAHLLEKIKSKYDVAVTLSLGEKSREEYSLWREAGADRYLIRHETASAELFKYLKPDTCLENRLQCVDWLRELGYQIGLGNMIGLPGQNLDILVEDILLMNKYLPEMAGIGPFLPHPNTPLRDFQPGNLELCLKVLAVARLCLPYAHLPVTTALRTLAYDGYRLALQSGANVIMPNMTPKGVKNLYVLYPEKADIQEEPQMALQEIEALLYEEERVIGKGYGHGIKYEKEG